jgi:hypothetical protein
LTSPTTKKHIKEAEVQGCKLLGAGKNKDYHLYALPCGHEQVVFTASMRDGSFRCSACFSEKLKNEAEAQGCTLLGAGRNHQHRLYTLSCGHEQEVATPSIRKGGFSCRTCASEKLPREAAVLGCKLLGPGKNDRYRLYQLPCGHRKEAAIKQIRKGLFRCGECTTMTLKQEVKAVELGRF